MIGSWLKVLHYLCNAKLFVWLICHVQPTSVPAFYLLTHSVDWRIATDGLRHYSMIPDMVIAHDLFPEYVRYLYV